MLSARKGTRKNLPYNKNKNLDWRMLKADVITRDNYTCQMCKTYFGHNLLALTIHHIKPRKRGGSNSQKNLISLCGRCHDIAEFNEFNYNQIIHYHKKVNKSFKKVFPPKSAYLWEELK